jgi:signal transduction histidine kinase
LFAIGLAMQGTHRRATSPAVAGRLAEHIDQLHDVIQDIRTAIFDLHADPTDTPGLRTTLHEAITQLTADASLRTTVRMSGPVDAAPTRLAEHAVAVVCEAVSNAVRHAHAHESVVTISVEDLVIVWSCSLRTSPRRMDRSDKIPIVATSASAWPSARPVLPKIVETTTSA